MARTIEIQAINEVVKRYFSYSMLDNYNESPYISIRCLDKRKDPKKVGEIATLSIDRSTNELVLKQSPNLVRKENKELRKSNFMELEKLVSSLDKRFVSPKWKQFFSNLFSYLGFRRKPKRFYSLVYEKSYRYKPELDSVNSN